MTDITHELTALERAEAAEAKVEELEAETRQHCINFQAVASALGILEELPDHARVVEECQRLRKEIAELTDELRAAEAKVAELESRLELNIKQTRMVHERYEQECQRLRSALGEWQEWGQRLAPPPLDPDATIRQKLGDKLDSVDFFAHRSAVNHAKYLDYSARLDATEQECQRLRGQLEAAEKLTRVICKRCMHPAHKHSDGCPEGESYWLRRLRWEQEAASSPIQPPPVPQVAEASAEGWAPKLRDVVRFRDTPVGSAWYTVRGVDAKERMALILCNDGYQTTEGWHNWDQLEPATSDTKDSGQHSGIQAEGSPGSAPSASSREAATPSARLDGRQAGNVAEPHDDPGSAPCVVDPNAGRAIHPPPVPQVAEAQCEHRDEDEDGAWLDGTRCQKSATRLSCKPFIDAPTCDDHGCRCPPKSLPSPAQGEREKLAGGDYVTRAELVEALRAAHGARYPGYPDMPSDLHALADELERAAKEQA